MIDAIYLVLGSPGVDDPTAPAIDEVVYGFGFDKTLEDLKFKARAHIAHTGVTLRLVRFVRAETVDGDFGA